MFGFEKPEDGSQDRFRARKKRFAEAYADGTAPLRHLAWWLVHNLVCHPLIAVLPVGPMFKFHDWTSRRMFSDKAGR